MHTYNESGLYSVTLTAGGAGGTNSLTKTGFIAVSGPLFSTPVTSFSASPPVTGKAPLTVSFTDQSKGSPDTWKWSFGDGNDSTEKNPVHTYNKEGGNYTVALTTTSQGAATGFRYPDT